MRAQFRPNRACGRMALSPSRRLAAARDGKGRRTEPSPTGRAEAGSRSQGRGHAPDGLSAIGSGSPLPATGSWRPRSPSRATPARSPIRPWTRTRPSPGRSSARRGRSMAAPSSSGRKGFASRLHPGWPKRSACGQGRASRACRGAAAVRAMPAASGTCSRPPLPRRRGSQPTRPRHDAGSHRRRQRSRARPPGAPLPRRTPAQERDARRVLPLPSTARPSPRSGAPGRVSRQTNCVSCSRPSRCRPTIS